MQQFEGQLVARRDDYAPALPAHITPERFQRIVVTAVNLNPDLLDANRLSLMNACCKAASDGLLPDGREGALVIFNTKEKTDAGERWIKKVQWLPMVYGLIKKARQSGEIAVLDAQIVYQNEIDQARFTYKRVDGVPKIDHEPIVTGPRGAAVLVYSVVKFKDGSIDYEVLHAEDVAKIRAVSKSRDKGPWADWAEEMWKKSAIRRHAKRLPISSELFDAISRDDEMTEFERQRGDAERKMLSAARTQLGAPTIDQDPEDGEGEPSEDEKALDADGTFDSDIDDPLADLETELLALDTCASVAAVDKLEQSVGAALTGDPEKLHAWTERCTAKSNELMAKGKKSK